MIANNEIANESDALELNDERTDNSEVKITESENDDRNADVDPGRTPGKAEGVENPEQKGNE